MNSKLVNIIVDGLILSVVSSIMALVAYFFFDWLKGNTAKDDPLVTAIIQGKSQEIERLVAPGAGATGLTDDFGRTALMRAAFANLSAADAIAKTDEKRAPIVALLVEHGAPIDGRDSDGWTALMWASWSGLDKTADKLLELGANPSLADRQGNTALTIAAQRGKVAIVRSLLSKGANPSAATKTGKTALDTARKGLSEYPDKKDAYQDVIGLLGSK